MAEQPVHILVIDDDAGQARLAQRTLERAGYTVAVAHDGDTGLALYATGVYDVLMVDHQMPGKGGLEVLRTVALRGALPPTIMVTGNGDEAIAVEAMKLGAGDYLVKDVEGRYLTLLPTIVARVLHQQRLVVEKQQAEEALRQTLAVLEVRVQERTAALQQANALLHAEIAERLRAEAALAQLNRRHKLILDSAGEGIYGVDREGRTTFVNPAAARMLGWDVEELIGQLFQEVVCHTMRDGTPCAHDTCPTLASCRDGVVRHVPEDVFWRQDGTSFLVEYVSTPKREHDTVVGAVIIFKDITARKRLERELQRTDRLALVGQLASGLAHEIGTPLNIIAGNAELLGMDLRDRGLGTAEVEAIVQHADRITRLIQQLLTFARAKEQPMTTLAVQEPLANALSLLEARFKHQGISVITEVPSTLPLIHGRAEQLEQVFLNVLVNAWHAMPGGGTLTIAACTTAAQKVRLCLSDTGLGMSADVLARAFEPFYSTKGECGTGLGLAICKQIIDSHQGMMVVESTPGVGTTVLIEIPQAGITHKALRRG
ncbi:MAG TPA: response regulator [Candidatus Tectomicrobia bacterium]